MEKSGQFVMAESMGYIFPFLWFWRNGWGSICYVTASQVTYEFTYDLCPCVAGPVRFRFAFCTPLIQHLLTENLIRIMICTIVVKTSETPSITGLIPAPGSFPIADKFFNKVRKSRPVWAHIRNTSSLTGKPSILREHSLRCSISAEI